MEPRLKALRLVHTAGADATMRQSSHSRRRGVNGTKYLNVIHK